MVYVKMVNSQTSLIWTGPVVAQWAMFWTQELRIPALSTGVVLVRHSLRSRGKRRNFKDVRAHEGRKGGGGLLFSLHVPLLRYIKVKQ